MGRRGFLEPGKRGRGLTAVAAALAALVMPHLTQAGSRLLATGGVTQVEGAAGGGLVPWALIAGLGSDRQIGGSASCTRVEPGAFRLDVCGLAIGIRDRVEFSLARQRFDLGDVVAGENIEQSIVAAKVRLLGDAVYDQDRWWPQLALGAQYKNNSDFGSVPQLIGAQRASDTDFYPAATKLQGRNAPTEPGCAAEARVERSKSRS
jgi:hypothetical protein